MAKQMTYEEATTKYDPVLGIEVHVELNTNSKAFDTAPVTFGEEPNTAVTRFLRASLAHCRWLTRSWLRPGFAWGLR